MLLQKISQNKYHCIAQGIIVKKCYKMYVSGFSKEVETIFLGCLQW